MAVKEKKDVFLIARVTTFDKHFLEHLAKEKKKTVSAVVRELIAFFAVHGK